MRTVQLIIRTDLLAVDQRKVGYHVQQLQAVCRARETLKRFNKIVRAILNKIPHKTVRKIFKRIKDYGYQLRDY